jgi:hypothetical protein
MSDSIAALAPDLDELLHRFGSDTVTYPHEFSDSLYYPVFHSVFEFWLSDGVSDRWTQSDFQTLIASVLDNDSTMTDDVFGIDWNYFVRSGVDANPYHRGVRLTFPYPTGVVTKIILRLYDKGDLPSPCSNSADCLDSPYGYACCGYSWYINGTNIVTINASPANAMDVVLTLGIAHELQHLCYYANGYPYEYESTNETMATLAEHLNGGWRPHYYDIPYDASIMRYEKCDANSKYDVEKMWIVYLYEVFKGNPSDPTDDLVYRWIHTDTSVSTRMRLSGLAATLWSDDYDWVGGVDATDRLNKVFANFLAAKFCNAPELGANGEYGMGPVSTVRDFALFLDNCDWYASGATPLAPVDCPENPSPSSGHEGCWNVRILPPEYTLSGAVENNPQLVNGIYEDGDAPGTTGDGSTDYVDVGYYGTDYVVFRAGSYYQDSSEHELEVRLAGTTEYAYGENWRIKPVGWIIGYSESDDTLQLHPEHIVFIEPVSFDPSTCLGDSAFSRPVTVTDFGRSVKAVVLAVGTVTPYPNNVTLGGVNRFFYQYEYAVHTQGASTRTWQGDVYALSDVTVPDGGTLEIDPGTHIKVFDSDLASVGADTNRVEINVDGVLEINGTTGDPVTIEPLTQVTSEDWAGIYFSSGSEGGTFNYCTVGYAENVIDSYAPISIDHSTIHGASDALIRMSGGTLDINDSEISLSNGDGIVLDDLGATIDSTTVEDCFGYGLHMTANAALNISHCLFEDCDTGAYVETNSTSSTISDTQFHRNDVGISYYGSTRPNIDECVISANTTTGIRLDHYSSPTILHCMDSASYNGDITGNGSGLFCTDHSSPSVGYCDFHSNNTGVGAFDDSAPVLDGNGANKFRTHSAYHVANLTTGITISAESNYWSTNTGSPNYYPKSTKILGDVDYANALSSAPNPTSMWPGNPPQDTPKEIVTGLGRSHPNPFNPIIQVPYSIKSGGRVEIAVYDVTGRLVRTLVHEHKNRGEYAVTWDGASDQGSHVASAVYFVRMRTGSFVETQKIVLLK